MNSFYVKFTIYYKYLVIDENYLKNFIKYTKAKYFMNQHVKKFAISKNTFSRICCATFELQTARRRLFSEKFDISARFVSHWSRTNAEKISLQAIKYSRQIATRICFRIQMYPASGGSFMPPYFDFLHNQTEFIERIVWEVNVWLYYVEELPRLEA